jgi:hypothetical protein
MQAIALMVYSLLAAGSPPEPLWSFVTSWSGSTSPSSNTQALTAGASPAAAAAAAAAAAKHSHGFADAFHPPLQSVTATDQAAARGSLCNTADLSISFYNTSINPQHMNIMTLAYELTVRLWELLADASIVGGAQGPAPWLCDTSKYTGGTLQALGKCITAHAAALVSSDAILTGQHTHRSASAASTSSAGTECPSPGQAGMASAHFSASTLQASQGGGAALEHQLPQTDEAAVQRAHELCSLVPVVPWERFKKAASHMANTIRPTTLGLLHGMEPVWEKIVWYKRSITAAGDDPASG